MVKLTKEDLIDFENEIKELYEQGKIHAPIHFSGGNEEPLIEIFNNISNDDWVFSTHRNHYHALLKGIDRDWLKNEIINKRSMHINSSKYKFLTSSIVGGILPIALGTALAVKLKNSSEQVWVFIGDMASEMGVFHECIKYAKGQDLPINFVIEDNGISVDTPTKKVWGEKNAPIKVIRYNYNRTFPHHGIGKWVNF